MKISRNWLQTYFDNPIPAAAALGELFTFHSFEVEGLEKVGDDDVLDVKILPDRAHYALCHQGIALEVSVLTKQPLKAGRLPPGPKDTLAERPDVRIEAPDFCRRYMARYGTISHVAPSNPRACEMLGAIGQRAINAVVDATNTVMFDIGQPLHAFDADRIKGTIVIRTAKKGEKILLLDSSAGAGREVELLETDHVIADNEGPIAIAGVKGGKRAGVTEATRRIIVESASFDPGAVRRTATRLNLRSESSKRYENEITPELTAPGMDNVCALIAHTIPESAFGPIVDEYPQKPRKTVIEFNPGAIEERLGVAVPFAEAKGILERMNIAVVEKNNLWVLTIPFERLDLGIREDIIEEIGRVYGYEHIKGLLPPQIDRPVPVLPAFYVAERIKNILVGAGFSEVSLYTLVGTGDVETAYPLAADKAYARKNMTDGIRACLERNIQNADLLGLDAVRIFEIGRTFSKDRERTMLAFGAAQIKKMKGVTGATIVNSAIALVEKELGVTIAKPAIDALAKAVAVELDLDAIVASVRLPPEASYADLGFGPASKNAYKTFSHMPFIVRDIAIFVPAGTKSEDVWSVIENALGSAQALALLAKHSLFDSFEREGKISYAFRMVFQSMTKTLTDDEVHIFMKAIYEKVRSAGWEVR